MKGTIHYCLEEAIKEKYGEESWEKCKSAMGYPEDHSFMMMIREDMEEESSIKMFSVCADSLGVTLQDIFDLFGEYWCVEYAPNLYGAFFIGLHSSKEAITKLDWVHDRVTKHIPNAKPPRFNYAWLDEHKLQVTYKSDRNLMDLFISLIKGLNKKFKDNCTITKLNENHVLIDFDPRIIETTVIDKFTEKSL